MPTPVHRLLRNTTFWVLLTLGTLILSIVALCIALQATSNSVKATSRSVAAARVEARAASTKAIAAAQAAADAQAKANRVALEAARQQFCKVIEIQASEDPPPTTARGFAAQRAYQDLAKTPFLHCTQP